MQWMIDIIIEYLQAHGYLLPAYIYRGDPGAFDFTTVNFNHDQNWHTLDLSAIIPAGTKAVDFRLQISGTAAGYWANFKMDGQANSHNCAALTTQAANVAMELTMISAISTDRKLEYKFKHPANWNFINFVVKGWIL